MDYKELLSKYAEHVGICEGVDFIADHHRKYSERQGLVFTDEEWAALLYAEAPATVVEEPQSRDLADEGFEADVRLDPGIDAGRIIQGMYVPPHGFYGIRNFKFGQKED